MGVPILTSEGYEADDVIGALARQAAAAGFEVAIVTGDKDFFQLVGGAIRVYNPKDDGAWFDADGVKEKFGVAPSQVVDVLALMGDTSDNVKGVPGIGEKGARDLISTFGSLDALLERASEVKAKKQREALLDLRRRRPPEPPAGDHRHRRAGGVRSRRAALPGRLARALLRAVLDARASAPWSPSSRPPPNRWSRTTPSSRRSTASARIADEIRRGRPGRAARRRRWRGRACAPPSPAWSSPRPHGRRASCPSARPRWSARPGSTGPSTLAVLKPVLEDAAIAKVGHDLKFAAVVLGRQGVALAGFDLDTMLAAYLLDASRSSQDLEPVALEQLGYKALTADEVRGKGAKAVSFGALPPAALLDYAGERADLSWQLAERFRPELDPRRSRRACIATRAAAGADPGRARARRRARRRPGARRPGGADSSRSWRRWPPRSTAWPASPSTSARRSSSARSCSRS